ncbi:MAG: ATP-binding protein, partial [Bacteroidota bacterium]
QEEHIRSMEVEYHISNNIWSIYQDQQLQIWVGSERGIGYWDTTLQKIKLLPPQAPPFEKLSKSFVHSFVESKNGYVWLGTSTGLYAWSPQTGFLERYWSGGGPDHYLPHNNILHLHEDTNHVLWLATGGGGLIELHLHNQKIERLQQHTTATGLSNNHLYAIYEDQQEQLWMSSNFGIIQFDKKSHRAKAYLPKDGTTHFEFNRIAHYRAADGRLYFGSLNGVTAFYPEEVSNIDEGYNAPLQITHFQKYDGQTDQLVDQTAQLWQEQRICLQPGDRFFVLQFVLLDFVNADQHRYRYRIEGIESDWQYLQDNTIRLSGLPYGNYQLHVQGQGADGRFSTQTLQLPIQVIAPLYDRSWFRWSMFLFSLLLFFAWYRWRTKALLRNQATLEALVEERTQTIAQQAEELRQMDQMKSRFFTNVSHELRTPLTLMLGPIETLIKRQKVDLQGLDLLKMAQDNGRRLLQLVNEILNLSKLEAQQLQLEETPVCLLSLLEELLAPFQFLAQQKGIDLRFDRPAIAALHLQLDTGKVKIIIDNLLANACKFTPPNGMIQVAVAVLDQHIQIRIKDDGIGIHPDDLPHIFDRFYQSKRDNAPAHGGTGIGLALSSKLAQFMGGQLRVESQWKMGSTFYFEFPITEQLDLRQTTTDSPATTSAVNEPPSTVAETDLHQTILFPTSAQKSEQQSSTILLVEDNTSLRQYLQLILQDHHQVHTAENGQLAWAHMQTVLQAQGKLPDLILSDVMMPVLDGFQLLNRLKQSPELRAIPVILLTARTSLPDKIKALRIGVDDYVTKPFEQEELFARIDRLLRNTQMRKKALLEMETEEALPPPPTETYLSTADAQWLAQLEALVLDQLAAPDFSVERMAKALFLSRRQLTRRVKQCTGLSAAAYLKEARLNYARQLLENKEVASVKDLAYRVGSNNADYFGQLFKERFGRLPSSYF